MSDVKTLSERIDALETRLTFQDETIETLNKTITAQWLQIDALTRQLATLSERLQEAEAGARRGERAAAALLEAEPRIADASATKMSQRDIFRAHRSQASSRTRSRRRSVTTTITAPYHWRHPLRTAASRESFAAWSNCSFIGTPSACSAAGSAKTDLCRSNESTSHTLSQSETPSPSRRQL